MDKAELRKALEDQGVPEDVIARIEKIGLDPQVGVVPHADAELTDHDLVPVDQSQPAPEGTQPQPELKTAMVEFKGESIMVKMPSLEQITIIRRLSRTFGEAAKGNLTAERAVKLMDRAVKATCSVVARPEDVETVEDLMLDGVRFEELMPILVTAMEQLRKANQAPSAQGARLELG